MRDTSTLPFRFFSVRVVAVFLIAALFLFFGGTTARAQDEADEGDEIIFDDEEFAGDEEAFDAEALDAEATAEDEEAVAEDEGGFWDTMGDFFRDVKDVVVDTVADAYDTATDFLGFGDEEEAFMEETEEPAAPLPETAAVPEDTDVEAPAAAPKTNSFALRVSIAARDVDSVLAAARGEDVIRYEPRSFEIPDRGLLTLRASQDGPLFCLTFDLSEFRVAAALDVASFEVSGVKGAAEEGDVNIACVGLPSLSATAPLVIEAVFR